MCLADQFDRLAPMSGAGQPSASSEQKASHFFRSTNKAAISAMAFSLRWRPIAALLLLPLGKLAGLRLQGEHWVFIGLWIPSSSEIRATRPRCNAGLLNSSSPRWPKAQATI